MKEFFVLISQIIIIMCVQQLSEVVFDPKEKPQHTRLITVACFAGSYSLILQYVFNHVLKDLVSVISLMF